MFKSLNIKIVTPLLATSILISIGLIYLSQQIGEKRLESQLFMQAQSISDSILYTAALEFKQNHVIRMVNSQSSQEMLRHLVVISGNPQVVFACNENAWIGLKPEQIPDREVRTLIQEGLALKQVEFLISEDRNNYHFMEPTLFLSTQGTKLFPSLIFVSLEAPPNLIEGFTLWVPVILAAFCFFGLLNWYLLRQIIQVPVRELLSAMRQRADGKVHARARIMAEDELGDLAENYNQVMDDLWQSEERFRQLADNTNDVFWIIDIKENQVLYLNQAFQKIWQVNPDLIYRDMDNWLTSIHPEDLAMVTRARKDMLGSSSEYQAVFRILQPDGEIRWIQDMGVPVLDRDGTAYRMVGIARDITEEKRVEASHIEARKIAEHAARTKSEFLANMSHEIRTPMNGILGAADLLVRKELNQDEQELAKLILDSSQSLLRVINDILDFSKIEAGKLEIEDTPFDLRQIMVDMQWLLNQSAQEKGLDFQLVYSEDIPRFFVGDPGRIRQIMLNLVGNAIKFTSQGGITVTTQTTPGEGDECHIRVAVADTGIGIPQNMQEHIFDSFSQVDSSITRRFGGTGLGLAISKKLAGLIGGDLTLESVEGEGAVFTLSLTLPTSQLMQNLAQDIASSPKELGLKILLVEDNPVNQKVACRLLKKLSCQTTVVENGQEAVKILVTETFDVLLMDLQMPIMDGLKATSKIRTEYEHLNHMPIIALTANAAKKDREACMAVGMNGFLTKPIKLEPLAEELLKWLPGN